MNIDKVSVFITLAVISVLVLASPTMAAINIDQATIPNEINLGDSFEFNMTISDPGSFSVDMKANGTSAEKLCTFELKGNNLKKLNEGGSIEGMPDQCRGVKIQKPGSEYGYGYGSGDYTYQVRFETNKGFIKDNGAGKYVITLADGGAQESFELNVKQGKKK